LFAPTLSIACTPAPSKPVAPPADAPTDAAPLAADAEATGALLPTEPRKATSSIPNWTFNGSDESSGMMVLRCENAFPPDNQSGKCSCEGYELNVCVDGIRQLVIDRKQCGFVCKPTPQSSKIIALRCPDGSTPEASPKGCACSGRKPMSPCAGGVASAKVTAGECTVACSKEQ
jgi:hypothetical protein